MTKEQLVELGLDDDQIREVFKLNGLAVNKVKEDLNTKETELEDTKKLLKEANKEIEGFKEMDLEGIKQAAEDYKIKFEKAEEKAKEEIADLKFNAKLDEAIRESKGRNTKAVKALLDLENLKESENFEEDVFKAIKDLAKDNDYLFGEIEEAGTGGDLGGGPRKDPPAEKNYGSELGKTTKKPKTDISSYEL